MKTFQVVKDGRQRMLITMVDHATMETTVIDCTVQEALQLMWKIHSEGGGKGEMQ